MGGTSGIPNIVHVQPLGTDVVRLRDRCGGCFENRIMDLHVGLYWEIYGFGDHELKGFGKNLRNLLWLLPPV